MSTSSPTQTEVEPLATIVAPLHIQFDGSLRRPDDHDEPSAAIGYRLADAMGNSVAEESYRLAYWRSNTHVEYDALIAALKHAAALDYTGHLTIHGDAESVFRVVDPDDFPTANDRFTQRYAEQTRELLEQFESYSLDHRPQQSNTTADGLADEGHSDSPIPL